MVSGEEPNDAAPPAVIEALADDLNTSEAIKQMHGLANAGEFSELKAAMKQLGLLATGMGDWTAPRAVSDPVQKEIGRVLDKWFGYRREKAWAQADAVKNDALVVGIEFFVNSDRTPAFRFKRSGLSAEEYIKALCAIADKDY